MYISYELVLLKNYIFYFSLFLKSKFIDCVGHFQKLAKGEGEYPHFGKRPNYFRFFSFEGFPQLGWYVGVKLPESLFRGKLFSMSDFMFPFTESTKR